MEYIIIIVLQLIGIGLHVAQKVREIDKRSDNDSISEVLSSFFKEDWVTLFISGLVLVLNLVSHYILNAYTNLPTEIEYYNLYGFGIALVLGYAGQRIVYKYLGRAEEVLTKKVEQKLNAK